MQNGDTLIEVKDLHKSFGKHEVLKGMNMTVKKGEVIAIIGPSGCGKSTFLRSLNLLEEPTSGVVTFEGVDITDESVDINEMREKMGMVFQQFNLLDSKTVFHNIALPLILEKAPKDVIEEKVNEVLRFVELEDKKDTYVSQLSGGQKQRVGIARALTTTPDILLCDEATSALDPQTTESILKLLKKINKEMGVTILLITHQM